MAHVATQGFDDAVVAVAALSQGLQNASKATNPVFSAMPMAKARLNSAGA